MKTMAMLLVLSFLMASGVFRVGAATYYVAANGTNPLPPYADWSTAATNIQDAANLAVSGDTIWVTNGVYQYGGASFNGSNRVYLAQGVLLQSLNGPAYTTIKGYWDPVTTNANDALRCVYLSPFATVSGFTLTNGATQSSEGQGGGAFLQPNATVTNCVIVGNAAEDQGGGCDSYKQGIPLVVNCVIKNNFAPTGSGVSECVVHNSLVAGNGTTNSGSPVYFSTLYNCTISGNSSQGLGAAQGSTLVNSIIYGNTNGNYPDCYQCLLTNCCTTLGPGSSFPNNSFSNAPDFVNASAGDYHLQTGSPCVDAGNNLYVTNATDLDGNPRIVGAAVDMGCYENQNTNEVLFVSVSGTNATPPYASWATAATNIQDAIAAAPAGGLVIVGSGVYKNESAIVYGWTNRVALTNGVTLLGINGPQTTVIVGSVYGVFGSQMRCAYVGSNSMLSGFTLASGTAENSGDPIEDESGGGAWCESSGVISNCVVGGTNYVNGSDSNDGSTAYVAGGGVYGGTIYNSTLVNNTAPSGGGAAKANLINCLVTNNASSGSKAFGGVDLCTASNCAIVKNAGIGAEQSTLYDCLISNNFSGAELSALYNCTITRNQGGGVLQCTNYGCIISGNTNGSGGGAFEGVLYDCVISNNTAISTGGGVFQSAVYDCVIAGNKASAFGGGGTLSALYNCTVAGNSAMAGGGINGGTAYDCIIYDNSVSSSNPAVTNWLSGASLVDCDTTPLPSGAGNITNDPAFVNLATIDYHLQSDSPCINSGDNLYVSLTNDLDGNPRISGGRVDMGAFEYQNPPSILSYAWAQEYGLPTDGSADYADSDGIGMPNWEKAIAGLNPTNAASVLAMSPMQPTNNASGIVVTWQSVTNVAYDLQQSTNLPAFYTIQSNLLGQAGTTSFTDTSATNAGPYFYRVGVE
ncbi:MAG TPA: choice-of-anchor Q domain-containing protein [Verrucomicrobiae bacterium]|jgi:hypothetical protein